MHMLFDGPSPACMDPHEHAAITMTHGICPRPSAIPNVRPNGQPHLKIYPTALLHRYQRKLRSLQIQRQKRLPLLLHVVERVVERLHVPCSDAKHR